MTTPGFTGAGIDRADRLRLDEAALSALAAHAEARLLRLADLDPVLDEEGRLLWTGIEESEAETIFLGLEGDLPLFAPLVRTEALGRRAWGVFRLLGLMSPRDAALWGAARSLNEWHNRHLFCGLCGAATAAFRGGWGRRCAGCAAEHFPRVDPVVIMLAIAGGRCLLGRQARFAPGMYSALAGFLEPGETIEEAVRREVKEESGISIGRVAYHSSQAWPFPSSLMIGCHAEALSTDVNRDAEELEDCRWFDREEIRLMLAGTHPDGLKAPFPMAIAHHLIAAFAT
jgi:NAD+ diphosphatase